MLRAISSLLLLLPIVACATHNPPPRAQILGLEAFQQPCSDEPAPLSDEEAQALARAVTLALAMPNATAEDRARSALFLNKSVLSPLTQNALALRTCVRYERARADGAVSLGARFNQAVAAHH